MFTNTYLPHVGGVARSVKTLEDDCRARGHEVKVIAPESDQAEEFPDVLRVPAIQNFNGSDFSVRLPSPSLIRNFLADFEPDIIHSHHPFLLGDAAIREGMRGGVPVVFTHHTLYEQYTHYVPGDSEALKRVAIQLATEYCNLCSHVIAPSESVARLLKERGVETEISAIPTGIETKDFAAADGVAFRAAHGISEDAVVIGHVGRLAEEKNLGFLARSVKRVMEKNERLHFLLVGTGSAEKSVLGVVGEHRVTATGALQGVDLHSAYAAMDLFAFASQSETQGMVLAEAMAAGTPVIALDGPGVREILRDSENGVMLAAGASEEEFSTVVLALAEDDARRKHAAEKARKTAAEYDRSVTTDRVISLYKQLVSRARPETSDDVPLWDKMLSAVSAEWELAAAKLSAVGAAVAGTRATEAKLD